MSPASADSFTTGLKALEFLAHNGVKVSARIDDISSGQSLLAVDDYIVMPTASVGKVLLLIDVAAHLQDSSFPALQVLERTAQDEVAEAGLWQHLQVPALPISDVAALVAATSDTVATNVLVRAVGLDSVRRRTEAIGLRRTAMLDRVRATRGPDDAPHVSLGSMRELSWLFGSLVRGEIVDQATSGLVTEWLSGNMDLSLVASAFGMDPLAHRDGRHGLHLINKTGADSSIRVEAGVLRGPRAGVSYAVAASFADSDLRSRLAVVDALRTVGEDILEYVV
ncbi:serine hydrolase [Mycetocola reblochoni]|uniref:Beta-lactamase related protein n=1 Tax=Mycetocola reblochoni REB411 TaxID=1255698 RepID=A0A1R4J232_9MICO|nr:serine hydrolase [Mycetocola reblochoni]SJN25984.1 Beta-lactamase related protein [Mycetocola reblochoni REB411]